MNFDSPAWSSDGTELVFLRSGPGHLGLVRAKPDGTGGLTDLGPDLSDRFTFLSNLTVSPDGSRLAFTGRELTGKVQLYVMDVAGQDPVALTQGPSDNGEPTWSPDGQRIAFVSNRDGNFEVYVMNANGENQIRLTDDPADDTDPAWRP
jgi:Tol biopolymer transport system component